jgi:signal transduction histidine kinase
VRQCGTRFEEVRGRLEVQKEVRSAFCQGDAARLLMVLHNVLANALKYSPAGGVVRVAVFRQNAVSGDRSVLHCAVTDAGPGVPAECRARVFEKFFRLEHHRRVDAKACICASTSSPPTVATSSATPVITALARVLP